jgi:hypothetical protein
MFEKMKKLKKGTVIVLTISWCSGLHVQTMLVLNCSQPIPVWCFYGDQVEILG